MSSNHGCQKRLNTWLWMDFSSMCWIQPSRTSAVCGELFLLVDLTSTLRGWSLITEVTYSHLISFWEVSFISNISWQLVILIFPVTGTFLYWQSTFGVYWEEGICLSFVKFKDLIPFAFTLLKFEMILGKYSFLKFNWTFFYRTDYNSE